MNPRRCSVNGQGVVADSVLGPQNGGWDRGRAATSILMKSCVRGPLPRSRDQRSFEARRSPWAHPRPPADGMTLCSVRGCVPMCKGQSWVGDMHMATSGMFQRLLSPATPVNPNKVAKNTQQLIFTPGRQVGKAHWQGPADLRPPADIWPR